MGNLRERMGTCEGDMRAIHETVLSVFDLVWSL
jgi:hypothetical protein